MSDETVRIAVYPDEMTEAGWFYKCAEGDTEGSGGTFEADVPASTAIRRRSIPNVSTVRLQRRLEFLRGLFRRTGEWAETRETFRARVRETVRIESELSGRGESFERVTRGGGDG